MAQSLCLCFSFTSPFATIYPSEVCLACALLRLNTKFVPCILLRPDPLHLMCRGGGELGKSWHHAGRLMKKANSIQDFLACATYLLDYKYAHQTRLAAWGISAGGLLVGAAINLCPNLFNAVILKVLPCFPPE